MRNAQISMEFAGRAAGRLVAEFVCLRDRVIADLIEKLTGAVGKVGDDTRSRPPKRGHVALVGAGPGALDLMTLRAINRLQQADVVLYDRLVDPEILDLVSAKTERIYVGKSVGANAWPQDRIDDLIVQKASAGLRVVRLKSGDPSIFGRASEELTAARAAGIDVEIVPGVTAASGCAAAMGKPLTSRGETDTLVITTGACRPGDQDPDWAHMIRPGNAIAFYMGVEKAGQIQSRLLRAGMPSDCPVDIVSSATTRFERCYSTTLGEMTTCIQHEKLVSPAILLVSFPKSMAQVRCNDIAAAIAD